MRRGRPTMDGRGPAANLGLGGRAAGLRDKQGTSFRWVLKSSVSL